MLLLQTGPQCSAAEKNRALVERRGVCVPAPHVMPARRRIREVCEVTSLPTLQNDGAHLKERSSFTPRYIGVVSNWSGRSTDFQLIFCLMVV